MENNFQFASAAITDRGLSQKRPQNEDSFLELRQNGLFAVADGVGGAQAGDVASQMAVEILGEAFLNMQPGSDAEDIMKAGIEKANAAIFQMSHDLPQLSTMATTVVALHLSGNIATIGHVGDSRLYRLDQNGNLFRETQDHSVVEEEVRAGRMTTAQAANHPSKNVISRALGAEPSVEIDMKTIMFDPGTTFLLCSDGITRHIDDFQIRELLTANSNPSEICALMKEICYQRGAEDNLTAVIVRISSEVSSNFAAGNGTEAHDFEESTIATARAPIVSTSTISRDSADNDEQPTQDFKLNETAPGQAADEESDDDVLDKYLVNPKKNVVQTPEVPVSDAAQANAPNNKDAATVVTTANHSGNSIFETDEKSYRIGSSEGGGSIFGKILGSLLLLLVGGVIGAAAFYFWNQNYNPPPPPQPAPQITKMETPNIPFTSFEENRRNVDRNPEQFIQANAADPQDATDYYLLGRAYLLTAKYPEAKAAFTEAKNRLAQTDEVNSKTIANEIAMSMAIINNVFAQSAFKKDLLESSQQPANSDVNANSIMNSNLISNQ
jgi:protein phosphatase